MKKITRQELLAMFDPSVHGSIEALADKPETTAMVVFENQQLDSSACGHRSVIAVGPTRTYKTVEECEGRWLNDLPSQRQYPTCYWGKP